MANLDTTNMLLGIMAAVSVLEALLLIGLGIGGFMVYRRVMQLVNDLETRKIATLRDKVNQAVGVARGIRAVIASIMGTESSQSAAPAAGSI